MSSDRRLYDSSVTRLSASQSKFQVAYDLLAFMYGWLSEGFDAADLQAAQGLLQELGECASCKVCSTKNEDAYNGTQTSWPN